MNNIGKLTLGQPDSIREAGNVQQKVDELRHATKIIYDSLAVFADNYDPCDTISKIDDFVPNEDKTFRMMYSEINSRFILLSNREQSKILSNIEVLLQYITENKDDKNDINDKIIRIIFKIYDHLQLINSQIDCTEKTIAPNIKELREKVYQDFANDIKLVEREHVTILGIFAAIVLAFVGTFTFSTSVLNNISQTPFEKLFITAFLILSAFHIIMSGLFNFLREINGQQRIQQKTSGIFKAVFFVIVGIILGINWSCIVKWFHTIIK